MSEPGGTVGAGAPEGGARRLAAILQVAATVGAVLLPLAVVGAAVRDGLDGAALLARLEDVPAGTVADGGEVAACLGLGALGLAATVALLLALGDLFGVHAAGGALTARAADAMGAVGRWLVACAALGALVPAAQRLVVTWGDGTGAGRLPMGLDEATLGLLIAGGTMAVIAAAMRQAAEIRRELDGIV